MLSYTDRHSLVSSDSAVRCQRCSNTCLQHTPSYFRHSFHNNNNSNNGDNSEHTEQGSLEQQHTCVRPSLRMGYMLAIYFDLRTNECLAKE
ncbi:hypothetical protein AND_008946 [Anopheles darlingi]|uniref:Uncharacterized protein n=1 Tax=Anopheles darlingi TaxID=43151 RepID=W5J675_ANODA|nr:hypothetical protein AND_008946 [Anopheles darlingi]